MITFAQFPNVKLTIFKIYAHKFLLNRSSPVSYEVFLLEEKLRSLHYILDPNFGTGDAPAGIYMLKVNNRNTRTRYEIYSKLTIKITLNIFHNLF